MPRLWHPRLIGPGAWLLIAALVTDAVYAKTLLFQWNEDFSIWLLATGLGAGGLRRSGAALRRRLAPHPQTRLAGWASTAALLSLLDAFVHGRDAYTAVVPQGLALSAMVAALLVILGWRDWSVGAAPSFPSKIVKEIRS